eukprot:COSAG04_NODE_2322_length_4333_cov_7.621871_8_plen_90_part_00
MGPPDSLLTSARVVVCRELGITPVLSGFNGHVPEALLKRVHPKANHTRARPWNGAADGSLRRSITLWWTLVARTCGSKTNMQTGLERGG